MKTLKKEEMSELIGQLVDVVEDYLTDRQNAIQNSTEKVNFNDIAEMITGENYDILAAKFKGILAGWDLAKELRYPGSEEKATIEDMEEWNTPTD